MEEEIEKSMTRTKNFRSDFRQFQLIVGRQQNRDMLLPMGKLYKRATFLDAIFHLCNE